MNVAAKFPAIAPAVPRQLPHNIEAEQSLLGAILVNNEAFYRVSDFLEAKHFFESAHSEIFEIASQLIRMGKLATPVTLKTFLPADADLLGMTVSQYVARLAAEATTIINAVDYGRTIYDLATRREMIATAEELWANAYDAPVDAPPRQLLEEAERRLYAIAEAGRYDGGFRSFGQSVTSAVDMVANAYQRDGRLSGIATGLSDLDAKMGGLQASDLIIVAGRPGMGKTALATNIAYNIARAYKGDIQPDGSVKTVAGGRVGFFSAEMSDEQLATRVLSDETGVASSTMRRGGITEKEFDGIRDTAQLLQDLPLWIDDAGSPSIAQVAARARRLKRQKGLDLVVVDYLQLMQGSGKRKSDNRVNEVTEISSGLKALAKELNVPVIALSQLSRKVEDREDKRPQLADLRESGSIEQDADVVLFVFREAYYLENAEPKVGTIEHEQWQTKMAAVMGKADVIIGKQRHVPTGSVQLQFDGVRTRFSDLYDGAHMPGGQ